MTTKNFFCFLAAFMLLFSCNEKSETTKPSFLIGSWERINDETGKTTIENWKSDFTGIGYTLKDTDTVFKEILNIVELNDTLHLKVTGVNEKPTLFKITSQTDTSFVAENPTHDFPTKINYWLENEQLKAHVSNNEFGIEFVFKKVY